MSKFTLWSVDGQDLIYTFPVVQDTNLPHHEKGYVTHTSLRAKGAVVVPGGEVSFNAILEFILYDNSGNYESIMALIDDLETKIPLQTPFLLRMAKTSTTYYEYKVQRVEPFEYPDVSRDLRNYRQRVKAVFLANSW